MQLCCLDVNFKVCVIWQTFPGVFMDVSLSMKIRMGLSFLGKNWLSKRPREFCLFTKGFYSFAVSYTLSYPQTMRNSNCHSMEAIIIIELSALCKTENGNQIKCLYLFSPHSILFGWINGIWMGKSPIKPLPTTILYTLRTMQ